MRYLNLTKRLFWMVAFFVIFSNVIVTSYLYHQSQELVEARAYSKAKTLQGYFLSMRYVYHQQFLNSHIDLNDSTLGFLPAHASTLISEEFSKRSSQDISIRNVSDRPRNQLNRANALEKKKIDYFNANPTKNEAMELIQEDDKEFFFFASPIRIEPYCLACHGKKENVLPYIAKRYDTAYDYKLGEVRGLTSIKMPKELLSNEVDALFWEGVAFNSTVMFILLVLMYIAIKELTGLEVEQKKELERVVAQRTEALAQKSIALEVAYSKQQHLYSVLRTVADSNQILITTRTLDELLAQTALCLHANSSFAHVKIILQENGVLYVKESLGFNEDRYVNVMEQYVFDHNCSVTLTPKSENLPDDCKTKMRMYNVREAHITALRSDKFAEAPLGVLTICTTLHDGFSSEERDMIEELAGDVGFAVNSFLQKESILKLSYYDSLTSLSNRAMLSEEIKFAIHACQRTKAYGALLFMDLDNFKSINDLKGHAAGDKLLVLMAQRLEQFARQNDVIARFGGDEFALLLTSISTDINHVIEYAEDIALKILACTKEPFVIDEHPFYLTTSIGIALLGENDTADELIAHADSAMYNSKAEGRNTIRFFDQSIQRIMEEKSSMLQELRNAIGTNQFTLHYQIQVNTNKEIIGVEALVRWNHPEKGLVSPAHFIPLCEESGLIIPLGQWVLEEAVSQIVRWQLDAQKAQWRISINVSAKQFEQDDFVFLVEEIIKKAHINPSLVRLELTESLLIGDAKKALDKIIKLKSIGLSLSVDDFGTGYSSLQYLKQLSVDELKIDQSFIRDFLRQKSDALIVEAIISIGLKFNMEVIAEGVETEAQFEQLKLMGCQNFQGYYFGKPTSSANL